MYAELIKRNPENTFYFSKFLEAKQLADVDEIVDIFESFQKQFPRAHAPRRLSLNYAVGAFDVTFFILSYLTKTMDNFLFPLSL